MRPNSSARERILRAAEEIVQKHGALHMTLDAVAAKAGVSKGGLIYHFPSQRDFLRAMLMGHIEHVETHMANIRAKLPPGPAREVKAFIQAWFSLDEKFRRTAHALLAVVTREPDLIDMARRKHREVVNALLAKQPNRELVAILLLAVEGVWMSELLGVESLTKDERRRLERTLLQLADEWCVPLTTPATRKPSRRRGKNG
jgi:AcrR family transcriptional regulator